MSGSVLKNTRVSVLDHEFTTELNLHVFVIQEFSIILYSIKGKMVRSSLSSSNL